MDTANSYPWLGTAAGGSTHGMRGPYPYPDTHRDAYPDTPADCYTYPDTDADRHPNAYADWYTYSNRM